MVIETHLELYCSAIYMFCGGLIGSESSAERSSLEICFYFRSLTSGGCLACTTVFHGAARVGAHRSWNQALVLQ